MQIGPITLDGHHVRLEPVSLAHVPALWRAGAPEEGTFRNHMLMPGGRIRHSVYFSITHDEWPRVKAHLEGLLAAHPATAAAPAPSPGGRE